MAGTFVKTVVVLLFGDLALAASPRIIQARALTPAGNGTLPLGWNLLGCYVDLGNPRTLNGASYADGASMTNEACVTYCKGKGYTYAGTEFSQECFCGSYFTTNTSTPLTDCQMPCTGNTTEPCGGSSRMNIFWNGTTIAPPVNDPGPPGWKFQGCYAKTPTGLISDDISQLAVEGTNGGHALTTTVQVPGGGSNMTVQACTTACSGFAYAGTEYSQECYCGNTISNGGANGSISSCNMVCAGNSSQFCGGSGFLDLYAVSSALSSSSTTVSLTTSSKSSASTSLPSSTISSSTATTSSGLSTRVTSSSSAITTSSSLLSSITTSSSSLTLTSSISLRSSSSSSISTIVSSTTQLSTSTSPISSVSSSLSIPSTTGPSTTSSSFLTISLTSSTTTVSGPVHVLSASGYTWAGCYSDDPGNRALTAKSETTNDMTVAICATFCSSYIIFGVEYSGECYCGNTLQGSSTLMSSGDCSMLCNGNQNQYCGGSNRLDLYKTNGSLPTTTLATTSTTSTTTVSVPTNIPTGWNYDGCFVDNPNARIVQYVQPDNQQLTVASCIATCAGLSYTVAAMEWGVQCFCGNMIVNAGSLAANQADCSMACAGNAAQKCGASNRMSIYHTGQLIVLGNPVPQTGGLNGWTYQGCRTDSIQNRTMPWFQILLNNNTATNCLGLCSKFGYMAGALQWGEECWCGDVANVEGSSSAPAPETDCSSVCTGNASEICGGSDRISYYQWTNTPLSTFHYPTGNAMGQYQYIIDSPIVPIISTLGTNGKVAFVEKYGTSLTTGSTGAYELDPSTMTWRTMHVESDVFCSASLILPDKAGRQINVGGWNYESVWGIRLYWPDGSPGLSSVNDWEEDYDQIHLLAARWYPTVLIMSNGSILVIGGETTAAGAPSATLELLPFTGGGLVYFEWLERTDPNNLYPFLAVLPSGGIFVAYYNEARILDPVTFATTKYLPNMPGSVNNFLAGRTYPVAGTMMLLPQHAPYHDPLRVLICGGSAPQNGAGSQAIDNCISTNPDDASPVWVLERMPSSRVMSCMVSLPDGTYLILNGAQQGVAGFRLGSRPNLQAVLYDPTLPIGSRMSIMASTTIARMYHSEASLLQDGRVIVSGSDPEDNNYPQEYRVEVFVPPYLLNGATQPSFTIQDKDWAYGEEIHISITLPTGNSAGARVSMIGATSSTHGNSMGQRTFFPACTCTTTTCTIIAPPDNKVCPPGWFQLFLLDGPTPSHSIWVRIGGDPAGLGNWPAASAFTRPGL